MTGTLTPEQRRTSERERIHAACQALLTSDGWRRWVRARSIFHHYSLNNQLLIALQAPAATHVAGFQAWRRLGRQVRKGERSIRILAPIRLHLDDPRESNEPAGEPHCGPRRIVGYRSVGVFDLSQTDPIPGAAALPLEPPHAAISGASHDYLLPKLAEHAASLDYALRFEATQDCDGYCDHNQRLIVVNTSLSPNAQVRVLVHELCHAHGADYKTFDRRTCEVIVDCATHIACATLGLDVSAETIPYITGWGEAGALEALTRCASAIDALARPIETALTA